MDQRERRYDEEETLRMLFESEQTGLWTALPVIVQSFDAAAMTCVLQPTVKSRVRMPDGTFQFVALPLLLDCPVVFPSAGGFTLTLPVAEGDEGLVVFASRCIDAWWQQGGVQQPPEIRLHDLSDGFYIPGVKSQPNVISNVSTTAAQIRTNDGTTFVEVNATGIKVHAGTVYEWDVQGYGQKITWTGGSNYTIDNYVTGAVITTNNHAISPPGPP